METIWNTMFLQIGRQGENGARVIRADVSQWLEAYPSGEVVLFVTRPTELTPYIPDGSSVADGILSWTVSGTDTGIAGTGRAELRLMDGDTIVKSEVVRTTVEPCLPGTDSPVPPTPEVTDWVTRFIDSAETVDEALENADAAVAEIDEAIAQAGDIVEVMQDKAPAILSTVGPADVATFSDGAAGMPMEVTVALDPIQAGSGDPAPDNVRAISGRADVGVYRAVENLLEITLETQTVNGVTFTNNGDGSIHVSGTASAQVDLPVGATEELAEDSYVWAGNPAGASGTTYFLTRNNGSGNFYSEVGVPYTASGVQTPRIYVRSGVSLDVVFRPQIIRASELESLSVTFPDPPGTVYGGTLTANRDGTGKLVVDRTVSVWDGTSPVAKGSGLKNYYKSEASGSIAGRATSGWFTQEELGAIKLMCNIAPIDASTTEFYHGSAYCGVNGTTLQPRIFLPDCETAEEAQAWLQEQNAAGHPLTWCFMLKEPITYDLTVEQVGQITSVKGVNNVWSAGEVTVTYAADTKAYVDGTVGSTETVYNADGYEWVQVSGVPNYGYACEIPLAGIPRQNVAVIATVTSATASDFSGFVAMLAPYYKVDVLAKKVTFYAAVPMYKITRVRAVYI